MSEENRVESDEERSLRRRKRIEEMKRKKRQAELVQKCVIPAAAVFLLIVVVFAVRIAGSSRRGRVGEESPSSVGQVVSQESSAVEDADVPESDTAENGNTTKNSPAANADASESGTTGDGDSTESSAPGSNPAGEADNPDTGSGEAYGPFPTEKPQPETYQAVSTAATTGFSDNIISEYGVVIDVADNKILAQKGAKSRISPASMTKVLTVLTAADALGIGGEDWESNPILDETFTITIQITDYSFVNDCSNVGFDVGEEVTVRDLFYGTILPSGADAALGLAMYVAETHEGFVELMNQELEKLGLSESSHITNCVGLYDEEHYSTVYDIGVILKMAADNPFCREVLSAHTYNTAPTEQHPEGLLLSNWFLRRIEDRDTHGEVICAKTGYVVQSKSCAASLAADGSGREYICVTAGSTSTWKCIADQVELYQTWLKAEQE